MEEVPLPPPPYGDNQMIALALAPKVTSFLSIVGCSYILVDVARNRKGPRQRTTYHRLIAGLSVCDVFFAGALFASTWPAPVGTPYVWGARGNTQTCTAQGCFFHLGSAAVLYNASLSTFYVLSIRCGWSRRKIAAMEPWLHCGPILFSFVSLILALALKLFNSSGTICKIAPLPKGCDESWQIDAGTTTCTRGDNAGLYNLMLNLIPKWVSIIIVTGNMILVYLAVRAKERASHRWSIAGNQGRMTNQIAQQSYLFVGALYITNVMDLFIKVVYFLEDRVVPFGVLFTSAILLPSQGIWNVLVYLRPRYQSLRRSRQRESLRLTRTGQNESLRQAARTSRQNRNAALNVLSRELTTVAEAVRRGGRLDDEEDDKNESGESDQTDSSVADGSRRAQPVDGDPSVVADTSRLSRCDLTLPSESRSTQTDLDTINNETDIESALDDVKAEAEVAAMEHHLMADGGDTKDHDASSENNRSAAKTHVEGGEASLEEDAPPLQCRLPALFLCGSAAACDNNFEDTVVCQGKWRNKLDWEEGGHFENELLQSADQTTRTDCT